MGDSIMANLFVVGFALQKGYLPVSPEAVAEAIKLNGIAVDALGQNHIAYMSNICFGGPDLKTAYITLSSTGKLVATEWPRPGLPLNFLNV